MVRELPVRPLAPDLVERLVKARDVISRRLWTMQNVDGRHASGLLRDATGPRDTQSAGQRVRQMNVSRNYPGVELVIKRVHSTRARELVNLLEEKVAAHNRKHPAEEYVLLPPLAYPLSDSLVAMAKTDSPTFDEMKRGSHIYAKWWERHKHLGITRAQVRNSCKRAVSSFQTHEGNIWIVGVDKNKKIVLMPLVDLF